MVLGLLLLQVYLCKEARVHLQEMKDKLIHVSNELLDNAAELTPEISEALRVERSALWTNYLTSGLNVMF